MFSSRLNAHSPVLSHLGLLAGGCSSGFVIKSIHCLVCSGSVGLSGPVLGFLDTQYYTGFYNECKLSLLKGFAELECARTHEELVVAFKKLLVQACISDMRIKHLNKT